MIPLDQEGGLLLRRRRHLQPATPPKHQIAIEPGSGMGSRATKAMLMNASSDEKGENPSLRNSNRSLLVP
jgi:hypothetical protein